LSSAYNSDSTKIAKNASYLSGAFLIIAGILQIVEMFLRAGHSNPPTNNEWDPEYLKSIWSYRNSLVSVDLFVDAFTGVAYATLLYAVFVLRILYKSEKGFARHFMLYAFVAAIALNVVGFLQGLGIEIYCRNQTKLIMDNPNSYPVHVLIAISAAYNVSRSSAWFLFGCDSLVFFVAFLITYLLARSSSSDEQHKLSLRHGWLGLTIGFVNLFLFLFEIIAATASSWSVGVGVTFAVIYFINSVILLPIWVFWMGHQFGSKSIPEGKGEAKSLLAKGSSTSDQL